MLGADAISDGRSFLIAANPNKAEGVVNYVGTLKEAEDAVRITKGRRCVQDS